MTSKPLLLVGVLTVVVIVAIVALTAVLTPSGVNPAFAASVDFVNAAGKGDDAVAVDLMSETLQTYVRDNCPEGRVSACVDAYTPTEWGGLISAVFRRAIPDGSAWDVQLVATYEEGVGFSGVCIYNRVEEVAPGDWRVTAWSGFLHCEEAEADLQALRLPDAVNRVP